MSKNGYCPVCRGSVRRQGKRVSKRKRINIIPIHYYHDKLCGGSNVLWQHALHPPSRYKITIVELPDKEL